MTSAMLLLVLVLLVDGQAFFTALLFGFQTDVLEAVLYFGTKIKARLLSSPIVRQLCCMDVGGGDRVLGAHTPYTAKLILAPAEEGQMEGAEADERSRARPSMAMGFSYVSKKIRNHTLLGVAQGRD